MAPLASDVVARIEELIRQGIRAPEIARQVGVARTTVTRLEHKLGYYYRPGPGPEHPWRGKRSAVPSGRKEE